jgi:ubiquitin-protein ligase
VSAILVKRILGFARSFELQVTNYLRKERLKSVMVSACATDLSRNPVDGFSAGLVDDSNLFEWNVTIIGPPDTL